ncbi:hypothetical protein [Vibrio apostichopi]|uniref:hypothetical protein n=1 Tax=Vibrio apostichopi TaxID=3035453 RepID=UPI002573407B|nr:hypothetical protein [Vibrio sp. FE10]
MTTKMRAVLASLGLDYLKGKQLILAIEAKIVHLEQTERQFAPDNQEMPHPVIDELNQALYELTQ